MPAAVEPQPDDGWAADARLVADALTAIEAEQDIHHGHGHDRMDLMIRSHALRKLPTALAAQLLRQEVADALRQPDYRQRPDRLFDWMMYHDGIPTTVGPVTESNGNVIAGGDPGRILILPALPTEPTTTEGP